MIETFSFSFIFLSGMRIFKPSTPNQARNLTARPVIIDCASGFSENNSTDPTLRSFRFFGGFFDMNNFSRATGAFFLAACLLGSSTLTFAQTAKTTEAKTTESKQEDAKKNQTASTTPAKSTKPLSTNEDPSMIGRRNINGGFIGKIAGGTEKEVRQGREAAAEVDRQAKFIEDPLITEYINRVGQNIVLHSDAKVPFTIKVIDSDEVNAFALPGGFFYVCKGLLLAADNEAELAGDMAHEIAHVTRSRTRPRPACSNMRRLAGRFSWAAFPD